MHVQVRDALADSIVNRDKRAFRLHAMLHRANQHLGVSKERCDEMRGEILQRLIVLLGNQQSMAGKKRTVIQESKRNVVFKNDIARQIACDDLAEFARLTMFHQLAMGPSPRLSEAMMISLRPSAMRTADPME